MVRELLHCFLSPFQVLEHVNDATLLDKVWQWVAAAPAALTACVEALQALNARFPSDTLASELEVVNDALRGHIDNLAPDSSFDGLFAGWDDLLGSESLQQYAMDGLPGQASPPQQSANLPPPQNDDFLIYLGRAAEAGHISGPVWALCSPTMACSSP